jgi:predicted outer membrane repeat protein
MSFTRWLSQRLGLTGRTHAGRLRNPARRRAARPRFRPTLEALEDRWLPSTLMVTNNLDSGPGSLRAEIAAAKSGDTIVFATSLDGQTITLTSGELLINKNLTITGPGAGNLTISGNNASRVFEVAAAKPQLGKLSLSGLTITSGDAVLPAGSSNTYAGEGGAIFNSGTLTVNNCVISGNNASLAGGAIENGGTVTVNNSVLSGNSAGKYGGGINNYGGSGGKVTVSNSTLSGNHAVYGGAIWNDPNAAMTLQGSTLSGNSAFDGAVIFNQSGTLTVSSCSFSSNSASFEGGAIYNAVFYYGTGIGTVTIQNSTLTGNSAVRAGGIYNADYGNLTISGSTVSNNTASEYGGGILDYGTLTVSGSTVTGNSAAEGGGIMLGASGATVTIKNSSSITGNAAPAGFGADVYNLAVLYLDSTSTIGILDGNSAIPI